MKGPFGNSPSQQQMQQTQARMRAQQTRNLQGGYWLRQRRLEADARKQKNTFPNHEAVPYKRFRRFLSQNQVELKPRIESPQQNVEHLKHEPKRKSWFKRFLSRFFS